MGEHPVLAWECGSFLMSSKPGQSRAYPFSSNTKYERED
jgi:hypothetical protein